MYLFVNLQYVKDRQQSIRRISLWLHLYGLCSMGVIYLLLVYTVMKSHVFNHMHSSGEAKFK